MKHLELHILQSFPVACLNRDDLNSPKTAIFGGVQRARVSSQSWKRAIREKASELLPAYFAGKRSRLFIKAVAERLQVKGLKEGDSVMLSRAIAHYLGKLDPKDDAKVKTLMFLSPAEFDKLSVILFDLPEDKKTEIYKALTNISPEELDKEEAEEDGEDTENEKVDSSEQKRGKKTSKPMTAKQFAKLVAKIFKTPIKNAFKDAFVKDAADIALFGRMVANDPSLSVEGAAMFSHALSTHKVDNELDFFAAIDDLQPIEDSGAGHTNTIEFNSATYYRFAAVNLDMLKNTEHLGVLSQQERQQVVAAFVRATLEAVPGMGKNNAGRRNSMNAFTRPAYVLGVVRSTGHPVQLVNAFEKPVWGAASKGYMETSIKLLKEEYEKLNTTWGVKADELASPAIPDKSLKEFLGEVIKYVD